MLSTELLMNEIQAVCPYSCAMRRKEEQTPGTKDRVAVGVNTMSVESWIAVPVAVANALVAVSLGDGRRGPSKIRSRHCTRGQHISLLRLSSGGTRDPERRDSGYKGIPDRKGFRVETNGGGEFR